MINRSPQASHTYEANTTSHLNTSFGNNNKSSSSLLNQSTNDDHDLFSEIKKKKGGNIKFGNYSNRKDLLNKNQSSIISYIEPEALKTYRNKYIVCI